MSVDIQTAVLEALRVDVPAEVQHIAATLGAKVERIGAGIEEAREERRAFLERLHDG